MKIKKFDFGKNFSPAILEYKLRLFEKDLPYSVSVETQEDNIDVTVTLKFFNAQGEELVGGNVFTVPNGTVIEDAELNYDTKELILNIVGREPIVADLSGLLDDLAALHSQLTTTTERIDSEIASLDDKIDTNVSRIDANINSLDNKVDTNTDAINKSILTLETTVNTEIERVSGDISFVDTKVNTNTSRIDAVDTDIDSLDTRTTNEVSRLDTKIDTNITTLDSKVDTTANRIDSDVSSLNTTLTNEVSRLDTKIDTEVNQLNSQLDILDQKVDVSVDQLSDDIDTLDEKVDTKVAEIAADLVSAETRLENKKVDKVVGKGLSTNDYDNAQKSYVTGMYDDNYFKGVSLNETTYVITFTRRDNTNVTIDLPLESVVVSGEYDNATKTIVLTLENGSKVNIPVGDLVAGLMPIPNAQKGETVNKTLTYGGAFKVLHIATDGTVTERTMTMPAQYVLPSDVVRDSDLADITSSLNWR